MRPYSREFSMDRLVSFRGIVLCKTPWLVLRAAAKDEKSRFSESRNGKIITADSYSDFNTVCGSISARVWRRQVSSCECAGKGESGIRGDAERERNHHR